MTQCADNRIWDNGKRPSDCIVCMDCCTSRDQVPVGANICADPGTALFKDTDGVWKLLPPGPLAANTNIQVGILFGGANTMDGKPGRAVVVRDNARVVKNCITWPANYTAADVAIVENLLDLRNVKVTAIAV
jgi:hypothetical protein